MNKKLVGLCIMLIGMVTIGIGLGGPALGLSVVFSNTETSFSLSYDGVIYVGQETTINARLYNKNNALDTSLASQSVKLYINDIVVDTQTTDSNGRVALKWTPHLLGDSTYKIAWAGNAEHPGGCWVAGDIHVSEYTEPEPADPEQVIFGITTNQLIAILGALTTISGAALMISPMKALRRRT